MTRDEAIKHAQAHAKALPESYYAEPFMPHEWVISAIMSAPYAEQGRDVREACSELRTAMGNPVISGTMNQTLQGQIIRAAVDLISEMRAALRDAESALSRCEFAGKRALDGSMGAIDSTLINVRAAIAKASA